MIYVLTDNRLNSCFCYCCVIEIIYYICKIWHYVISSYTQKTHIHIFLTLLCIFRCLYLLENITVFFSSYVTFAEFYYKNLNFTCWTSFISIFWLSNFEKNSSTAFLNLWMFIFSCLFKASYLMHLEGFFKFRSRKCSSVVSVINIWFQINQTNQSERLNSINIQYLNYITLSKDSNSA